MIKVSEALEKKTGQATLRGWVYRVRKLKGKVFVFLRDASGHMQVILDLAKTPEAEKLTQESSLEVSGDLKADERAPGGAELHATSLKIHQVAERFPIEGGESEAFLLDNRHLWLRAQEQNAIMKVRDTVFQSARDYFHEEGFYEVTPPLIVGGAVEGGSTLFEMKYFDGTAFLSQSAQLHLEAMCFNLEKVFSFSDSFRAEKSRTRRHLAEFTHLEGEMAWMGQEENMQVQEGLVKAMVKGVMEKNPKELQALGRKNPKELEAFLGDFERIKYQEALDIMNKDKVPMKWGDDFGADEERVLTKHFDKPFFITGFPREIKAFYMRSDPTDPRVVLGADLLAPEGYGEIIGGSERELDIQSMKDRLGNIDTKPYEWYFDLRRYGSVQHSGFGLGIERVIMWLCKLEHIRDTIPFPRVLNRAYP